MQVQRNSRRTTEEAQELSGSLHLINICKPSRSSSSRPTTTSHLPNQSFAMNPLHSLNSFFEPRKQYGAIFLRVLIGWRLIYGTQDNIFSWERMIEFRNFLEQLGTPFPLLSAQLSVYAQFICGILYIIGLWVRPAAIVMIINFVCALIIAHIGTSFLETFDALVMLFGSIFFLFYGSGKISIDNWRNGSK